MRLSIETSMNNISTRRKRTENLKSPQTGVTLWWPCVLTQIYASHYPGELKMGKCYIQAPLFPDTLPSQDPADWLNREHCRTWLRHQMEIFFALMTRWPVDSPGKGQRSGTLVFSLTCAWTNGCADNRESGDLRRYYADYDVTLLDIKVKWMWNINLPKFDKSLQMHHFTHLSMKGSAWRNDRVENNWCCYRHSMDTLRMLSLVVLIIRYSGTKCTLRPLFLSTADKGIYSLADTLLSQR